MHSAGSHPMSFTDSSIHLSNSVGVRAAAEKCFTTFSLIGLGLLARLPRVGASRPIEGRLESNVRPHLEA